MKEILRYIDRLRSNIKVIDDLRFQHQYLINKMKEMDESPFTQNRLKSFQKTNNEVADMMLTEKYFEEIEQ